MSRDLAEPKQPQEIQGWSDLKWRTLVRGGTLAMQVVASDGSLLDVSDSFAQSLGYDVGEIVGRNLAELVTDPSLAEYQEALERLTISGVDVSELCFRRKDGAPMETFCVSFLLGSSSDGDSQRVDILIDTTERKALERRTSFAEKMRTVGQLSAGVAHEINNLLAVVSGYLLLIKDQFDPIHPNQQYLGESLWAVNRGADLTRTLLDYSKTPDEEDLETISLKEVVRRIESLLSHNLPNGVQWSASIEGEDPLAIARAGALEQCLINLALNARDATSESGVLRLAVRPILFNAEFCAAHQGARPGNYWAVSIHDTGGGIPEDIRDRIYQPFFSTKPRGEGTGLGLFLVYKFVKDMGGYIDFQTEPGVGTEFTIYLRAADADGDPRGDEI